MILGHHLTDADIGKDGVRILDSIFVGKRTDINSIQDFEYSDEDSTDEGVKVSNLTLKWVDFQTGKSYCEKIFVDPVRVLRSKAGGLIASSRKEDMIQILKAAQVNLKEFIPFCESMEVVSKDELEFSAKNSFQLGIHSFQTMLLTREGQEVCASLRGALCAYSQVMCTNHVKEKKERNRSILKYHNFVNLPTVTKLHVFGRRRASTQPYEDKVLFKEDKQGL